MTMLEIEAVEDTDKEKNALPVFDPVAVALASAREKLTSIHRESRNEHYDFEYTAGDNMIGQCRAALSWSGLLVTLESVTHKQVDSHLIQACEFKVKHIETGKFELLGYECPVFGNAPDKAANSCNTGIWKYFLRGLFMLPMVCDRINDVDTEEPCSRKNARLKLIEQATEALDNCTEESRKEWTDWARTTKIDSMTNENLEMIVETLGGKK